MSGIIFDIKKFAVHDGSGIRTTIFFKGCPLKCWWCHNPESRETEPEIIDLNSDTQKNYNHKKEETVGYHISPDKLLKEIQKDRIFYDQSGGGVTFSGGEPMMQIEFLKEISELCQKDGISTYVDTSGYSPFEDFEKIAQLTDCFLYDIKLMEDESHQKYTGVSNKMILDNLKKLSAMHDNIIPRIPLIPQITDTSENLSAMAVFLKQLKNIKEINLLPYNIFGKSKYKKFNFDNKLTGLETQTEEQLRQMIKPFEGTGLKIRIES